MRPSLCRSCLASLLKLLNFLQTFVGVSIVLYSAWILIHSTRNNIGDGFSFDLDKLPAPWFVCALMGIGILVCLIAFAGHVAAEAISSCCLCFYAVFTMMLILLEALLVGFVVFNKHWEEELPYDSTGQLRRLRAFIEDNIDICEGVAITLIVIQKFQPDLGTNAGRDKFVPRYVLTECLWSVFRGLLSSVFEGMTWVLSVLLAMILRAMVPRRRFDYDSDEDFVVIRRPLLNPQSGSTFTSTTVDGKGYHSDVWSSRMRQKYGLSQN